MTENDPLRPPAHLSNASKRWWRAVLEEYVLQPHHERLLQLACESWDTAQQARRRVLKDGPFSKNRYGAPVPHPGLRIAKDARQDFAKLVRALDLDSEPAATPKSFRPPSRR